MTRLLAPKSRLERFFRKRLRLRHCDHYGFEAPGYLDEPTRASPQSWPPR